MKSLIKKSIALENYKTAKNEGTTTYDKEDVVPVIRCKDCKYYDSNSAIVNFMGCSLCLYHKGVTVKTDANDYCSHAEKFMMGGENDEAD